MKTGLLLFSVVIYASIARFWMIDKFPPLIDPSILYARILSMLLSIGTVILLFFYTQRSFQNRKISLLSSYIFTVLPWTIEQGRIASQVNNALFIFFLLILSLKFFKNIFFKIVVYLAIPLTIFLAYPQFWIFKATNFPLKLQDYLNNISLLLSPDFLFFKNITFWWGGIREVGVLHLSLLPFFIFGVYKLVTRMSWEIISWIIGILLVSAASPFFPESREFFLATPFISLIVALGIYNFVKQRNFLVMFFFLSLFLFIVYDIANFFHYYTIHYPQQILTNVGKINEPF